MPIVFNIKIAVCRIFAVSTLVCHFTSTHHVCIPPLLSRALHACMSVDGGSFELASEA